jgi:hypothetical protein
MTPRFKDNISNSDLRRRIATYFRDVLGKPLNKLLPHLPKTMAVRIIDGNNIRTAPTLARREKTGRDNSYVRVSARG